MKILAIDIGGTAIKYGITDENFNVCEFYEIPSEAKLGRDHLMLKVLSIVGTYYGSVDCGSGEFRGGQNNLRKREYPPLYGHRNQKDDNGKI